VPRVALVCPIPIGQSNGAQQYILDSMSRCPFEGLVHATPIGIFYPVVTFSVLLCPFAGQASVFSLPSVLNPNHLLGASYPFGGFGGSVHTPL
jgi:hypothetical protein